MECTPVQIWKQELHDRNYIHPTAIVDIHASIGKNNSIGPFCYVGPGVIMGDDNNIESNAVIGSPAEHRDFFKTQGKVVIGNSNTIREFVTINAGTTDQATVVMNNCIFLRGSHVGHDSFIESNVIMSCNSILGGHGYLMRGANIALGAVIH